MQADGAVMCIFLVHLQASRYEARLKRVHFSGAFLQGLEFLGWTCSLGIPAHDPFKFNKKSQTFTDTPCKSTCLTA